MQHFIPPKIPAAAPSAQFCADARQVVANPEQYAHRPLLRRLAWSTLVAERNLKARQLRHSTMSGDAAND